MSASETSFDMRSHREEMMRMFWPVDLRTGIPLTEQQVRELFARNEQKRGSELDYLRLTHRQETLLAAVRRGRNKKRAKHEN